MLVNKKVQKIQKTIFNNFMQTKKKEKKKVKMHNISLKLKYFFRKTIKHVYFGKKTRKLPFCHVFYTRGPRGLKSLT